jgi:hypothetical protein
MRSIRKGTIAGLLAVVATLLVINLAIIAPGQEAQAMGRPAEAVSVLFVHDGMSSGALYRLWSNGTVERNEQMFFDMPCETVEWCGWQVVPE